MSTKVAPAIGLGPVFWLLISEIYPLSIRGQAASVATMANWLSNFLVSLTFLSLLNRLGSVSTFLLYASFRSPASGSAFVLFLKLRECLSSGLNWICARDDPYENWEKLRKPLECPRIAFDERVRYPGRDSVS